ncbi:MAG: VanZ family protein [Gemmatimonadales bacterium]
MTIRPTRRAKWVLWSAIGLVLAATLTPGSTSTGPRPCGPLTVACGDTWGVDLALNLALFLPLGVAAFLNGHRLPRIALLGLLLSLLIETLQAALIPGRDPALRDLLANTAGAAAGAVVAAAWPTLADPTPAEARRLSFLAGGGLAAWLLAAGLLLQPSLPASEWYGQHRAELGGFDRFAGVLLEATLDGEPLPSGRIAPELVRRATHRAQTTLEIRLGRSPERTRRLAPIVSVFDQRQRKIVVVGQLGASLVASPRLRSEDWGLQSIRARFPSLSPLGAGEATLEVTSAAGRISATELSSGSAAEVQSLGPADWWRLVSPRSLALSAGAASLGAAAVLLLCFLPLGWLAAGSVTGRTGPLGWVAASAAALPAAIALVPTPLGLPAAPLASWVATITSWGLGWWALHRSRRGGAASVHRPAA